MISIFLFYNWANSFHSRIAHPEFRHCNIITYDGNDWVSFEMDSTGIITRCIKVEKALEFIEGLKSLEILSGLVVVDVEKRARFPWRPFFVRTCNEIARYISGVNIGLTFTPRNLYNKLLRYDGRRNYEILYAWRRQDGLKQRRQFAGQPRVATD